MPILAVSSAILMIMILSALGIVPQAAQATSQSTVGGPCESSANALYANVNLDAAVQVAQASQAFKVESARFQNVAYYSTFETDKWTGGSACVPGYQFFNVVFSATNSSGSGAYIVVSEIPQTLSVVGVTEQSHPPSNSNPSFGIDGSASWVYCGHNTNSCSAALTTSNPYDIIIVYTFEALDLQTHCTFSVSDTAGLSWTLRGSVSGRNDGYTGSDRDQIAEFWAKSSSALSSDTITESISGCASTLYGGEYNGLEAFGVSGANFNTPFDPNTSLPGSANGYSNTPSVTLSTDSNSNDMIIGAAEQTSYGVLTPGSGFSTVVQGGTGGATTEYEIVTSPVTNFQVAFGDSATWYWEQIADAIEAPVQGSSGYAYYWAGYDMLPNFNNAYFAGGFFYQPFVSYPPGGCHDFYTCRMSQWVGVSDGSKLAQDGTAATCVGASCAASYVAWYEMVPGQEIDCTGSGYGNYVNVNGGDEIYANTANEADNGGSNTLYDFYIYDAQSQTACIVSGQSYNMPNPTHADFILENPEYCGIVDCATLPDISTPAGFFQSQMCGPCPSSNIYNYYVQGAYSRLNMENAPCNANCGVDRSSGLPIHSNILCGTLVTNVSTDSIDPTGAFDMWWQTSQNTPYWDSGC